jgi:hypothetical protein
MPKSDHIYYSIDKEPDECARAVASLVKADVSVYPLRLNTPILEVIKIIGLSFIEQFIQELRNK